MCSSDLRALAETAQNIQVLTKAQIEDSGYTDLREILDAQPGITLGTGENGNAFGDRYNQGWQEVEYFVNQTNLHLDREIGGLKHEFIFGLEYSDHSVLNGVYDVANSGENCLVDGRGGVATAPNGWCITDASGALLSGIDSIMNRRVAKGTWDIDWNVKTVSLSAMDTVDLTDKWTAFAGLRWDQLDSGTQDLGANDANLEITNYKPKRASIMVDYSWSEFSRMRLQYAQDKSMQGITDDQITLQYIMSLGPHGVHKF